MRCCDQGAHIREQLMANRSDLTLQGEPNQHGTSFPWSRILVHVLCRMIKEFNKEEAATNNGESDDDLAGCLEDLVHKR